MAKYLADLDYASLSDVGRRRLANEDACETDKLMGLFVVCDGIGGQPSGEAASQIVAHALGHMIRRRLRHVKSLGPGVLEKILSEAVQHIGRELFEQSNVIPALQGMGATIVAALIDGRSAYIVHAGDSRAYLLRDGEMRQLTQDHTRSFRQYKNETDLTDRQQDVKERRLLMSFLGANQPVKADAQMLVLNANDRLLLCSDGLTDPVADDEIQKILEAENKPGVACRKLVDRANAGGGPDNITMIVIDYKGVRPMDTSQRRRPSVSPITPKRGIATWFHKNLQRVEQTLDWLRQGTDEAGAEERLSAMASVKRRLGPTVFREFLNMHPTQNPAHVFHRAAASPNSPWRKQYEQVMVDLEQNFNDITDGSVRLSPLLSSEETGAIIRALWRDWRRVEQRYFQTCAREAIHESEKTLTILIDHMLASVRTLIGLLEFFPKFMRESPIDPVENKDDLDDSRVAEAMA